MPKEIWMGTCYNTVKIKEKRLFNFVETMSNKKAWEMAEANFEKIKVREGTCRLNYRCHKNAVHDALAEGQSKITMCLCKEGDVVFIHFVNCEGNLYVDNTLGVWSRNVVYRKVRDVKESEFFDVDKIFQATRANLTSRLPWYLKLLGCKVL